MNNPLDVFSRSIPWALKSGLTVLAATAIAHAAPMPVDSIGLGLVTIGNPGNVGFNILALNDVGDLYPTAFAGRGSVDYTYRITRSEVAAGDIIPFVQQFSMVSDDVGELVGPGFMPSFWDDFFFPGPGTSYFVNDRIPQASIDRGQINVSAPFAMAYANWLHNGQSDDPASLMSGAYDLGTLNDDGSITYTTRPTRQPGARFAVANRDEYMKAGYYDPDRYGPGEEGWWRFAHRSDNIPVTGLSNDTGDYYGDNDLDFNDVQPMLLDLYGVDIPEAIPLGSFPDAVSAYGLLDVMSAANELVEGEPGQSLTSPALLKESAVIQDLQGWAFYPTPSRPNVSYGSFRLVQLIPSPTTASVLVLFIALQYKRSRRVRDA